MTQSPRGPLHGVRVLDLTRILAGPTCTQIFGDLGADVIKVERPGAGDDTRTWGPPFVRDSHGENTTESAYYLCANRNKRSVAIDISTQEGQASIRGLVATSDVLVENYKVGGLAQYGLGFEDLHPEFPGLVYCSITGFGQTGPRARETGYDFLIQAMGGIMSVTGDPEGPPMKVGVGIADVMTGMYAAVGILAALRHRDRTGEGQHIDVALFDTQLAWLVNVGSSHLISGVDAPRYGNAHPTIVPYQTFATADGHLALAVGNDAQFHRLARVLGRPELASDPRYATNPSRVEHRSHLIRELECAFRARATDDWVRALTDADVPAGRVNTIAEAFVDPQAVARNARISMPYSLSGAGSIEVIANPLRFSKTPVRYERAPPRCGEHTTEVLAEVRSNIT